VLDPFIGSGTTGLVALNMNRLLVGVELNPDYVTIAEKRLDGAVIHA
jgi:DNA modification methylase